MAVNSQTEKDLAQAFVSPHRRSRYLTLLASPRGRDKVRSQLAHFGDLDRRFTRRVTESSVAAIVDLLRKNGAPTMCYILSESDAIDTEEMKLETAVGRVVGQGLGTIVSCVPGKLAYYEGEDPGERYLLKRT